MAEAVGQDVRIVQQAHRPLHGFVNCSVGLADFKYVVHLEGHKENLMALIQAPPIDLTAVAGRAGLERPTPREE
jgi:hypothetical protein